MERIVTIWRVQNEFGFGPYNGKGSILAFLSAHAKTGGYNGDRCPTPWQDAALSKIFRHHADLARNRHLRAGFQSVAHYKNWFATDYFQNALDATGFFLTRYSLPAKDVLFGDRQVVCRLNNAHITAFRRCNQPGMMRTRSDIVHKPIRRFLKNTNNPACLR